VHVGSEAKEGGSRVQAEGTGRAMRPRNMGTGMNVVQEMRGMRHKQA
jgi:hypothetical protein